MLSSSAFSQKTPSPDGKWRKHLKQFNYCIFSDVMLISVLFTAEFFSELASDEVLMHLFSMLDDRSLFMCGSVCKRFNQLTEDKRLWTRHNRQRWKQSKAGALQVGVTACARVCVKCVCALCAYVPV